ncbi:MAG: hypothetical protein IJV46_09720 [Acidaminococcaceae bacterium]|nr:hypothetical protein [Acidaminococcaceae bacterium]
METIFTELDCEHVRDVTIISRNGGKEQLISLNKDGVFRFKGQDSRVIKVMRLPSIKIWVFCSLICDMLVDEDINRQQQDACWEICASDNYGRRFRVNGPAVTFRHRPNYDPSVYLRHETGIKEMWLLDGKKAV